MTEAILRSGVYSDPDNEPPVGTSEHALWLVHWHLVLEQAELISELGKLYQDDIGWELHLPGLDLAFEGKENVLQHYTALTNAITDWTDTNNDIFANPTHVFCDQTISYKISPEVGALFDESVVPPGGQVAGRMLHNFHIRDGLIAREIAYFVPGAPPTP
jgi:hypothetical protein